VAVHYIHYTHASINAVKGVGGLVGRNAGRVADCDSTATVRGLVYAGGLVGDNNSRGSVSHSYSVGPVSDHSDPADPAEVEASGTSVSDGGVGKITAQMQTAGIFLNAGWDFAGELANGTDDVWWILEGQDYRRLWWEAAGAE